MGNYFQQATFNKARSNSNTQCLLGSRIQNSLPQELFAQNFGPIDHNNLPINVSLLYRPVSLSTGCSYI